ncbi:RhuM family protein [Aeromonas caviae]
MPSDTEPCSWPWLHPLLDGCIRIQYRHGCTTWVIRKNYLSEADIKKLERAVSAFFDYIEGIIERRNTFTMESFAESVNKFLAFNEYRILDGFGTVSRQQAEQKAFAEYEKFNKQQRIESDFDREVKKLLQNKGAKE